MSKPEEVQIYLGQASKRSLVGERPTPAEELATYVAACGDTTPLTRPVYVHVEVLRGVNEHAASSPSNEVGGVLLGDVYRSRGVEYVRIEGFLRATNACEQRAALTFTHDTWSQLNAEREARYPELRIVGWYHTHPGLGVFLSDNDRFIHRSFFADPALVALVVDPVAQDRAFFRWDGDKLARASGYYVFGDASQSKQIDDAAVRTQPSPLESRPASAAQAVAAPEVKVIFPEVALNLYYVLPRPIRLLFGITNGQTAPRISLKSMLIVLLLAVLIWQHVGQSRGATAREESQREVTLAGKLYKMGFYGEAYRGYCLAQYLDPANADAYVGRLEVIRMQYEVPLEPSQRTAFLEQVTAVIQEARKASGEPAKQIDKWLMDTANEARGVDDETSGALERLCDKQRESTKTPTSSENERG